MIKKKPLKPALHKQGALQNPPFAFSEAQRKEIEVIKKRYPKGREQSALLPLLWLAQRQNSGWLSVHAMEEVGRLLNVPFLRIYEVASFYTMFKLKPVGKYCVQVCRTTSCYLCGSDRLRDVCAQFMQTEPYEVTSDGLFSYEEVECLGACSNAPMVQINDDYFEDLSPDDLQNILELLRRGEKVKTGSQKGRVASKPFAEQACTSRKGVE